MKHSFPSRCNKGPSRLLMRAFTLIEVMLSMVILAMIMMIVTQVIGQAQKSWRGASSRVTQFREARTAFDTVVRNIRQASLTDYRYFTYGGQRIPAQPTDMPDGYSRASDLSFIVNNASTLVTNGGGSDYLPGHAAIFQAPLGTSITPAAAGGGGASLEYDQLTSLLTLRGYYVRFASDAKYLPYGLASRVKDKYRYRLYEYRPPTEYNTYRDDVAPRGDVTSMDANSQYTMPVAENIIAMAFGLSFSVPSDANVDSLSHPATSAASKTVPYFASYNADTGEATGSGGKPDKSVLPRTAQIIMVAIDEASADNLAREYGTSPPGVVSRAGASFSEPAQYDKDIDRLTKALQEKHVNYRVFSMIALIPASKT